MKNSWLRFKGTDWFQTIHPMTYFVVVQSLVWAVFILAVLILFGDAIFDHHTEVWPEPLAYAWAVAAIIGALHQLIALMRDSFDRDKETVWRVARVNLAVWAFSLLLWLYIAEYEMLIVTLMGMASYMYISLAKRLHRADRRI